MRWIADLLYLLAGLAYLPVALYSALLLGKNRRGWGQRFGGVPRFEPGRRRIWIHAVSLGEINATPKLVEGLRERVPDCDIVISTTTDTGYARAVQLYDQAKVFRFPLDFSSVVARALNRIKPSLLVLVELEVWYNLVRLSTRRGIPVAVVNGRLTQRSAHRFGLLSGLIRPMFRQLTWVGVQDETIARRFQALGTPPDRISITSSLKWDSALVADKVEGMEALASALGMDASRPVWVCGSTGPGEEELILEAYKRLTDRWENPARNVPTPSPGRSVTSSPVLAIVPRKPERFDEVARLIESRAFVCIRRSEHGDGIAADPLPTGSVVLGDTMGELRKFYALAGVVFVGRSLVPMGGSDPMEVAALGKAMVVGPYSDNFELPISALASADAIRIVTDGESLSDAIAEILERTTLATELGNRARQVVLDNQGATERTIDALVGLLASVELPGSPAGAVTASR